MKVSIGKRITISKMDSETVIKISGTIESWMNHALLGWLIMWTLIGLYVMYYIFSGKAVGDQVFFFIAYLAFWIYFEIKAVYSWLFRTYGFELIKITPSEMYIKRSLLSYGKVQRFALENISNLKMVETNRKSLNDAFNKAFWVIGNEQIQFDCFGKSYGLGMHLEPGEAKVMLVDLRKALKKKK